MLAAVPGLVETPGNTAITPLSTHPDANMLSVPDRALAALGRELRERGYRFTTITPASHKRVNARPTARAVTLQDIFGWSRPFAEADLPASLLINLAEAGALDRSDGQLRSTVRFSTLGDQLFAHSAFPTEQGDAVFLGPDTYRFARALGHSIATLQPRSSMRILDIGAGSGAGGLHAAALLRAVSPQIVMSDINHNALRFSRINAALNDIPNVEVIESDLYAGRAQEGKGVGQPGRGLGRREGRNEPRPAVAAIPAGHDLARPAHIVAERQPFQCGHFGPAPDAGGDILADRWAVQHRPIHVECGEADWA